jgi:hypothetical protein
MPRIANMGGRDLSTASHCRHPNQTSGALPDEVNLPYEDSSYSRDSKLPK